MNTPISIPPTHRTALASVLTLLLLLGSATLTHATERTYLALWSGASFGNTAQAAATVVIDDALLLNPGRSNSPIAPGNPFVSFDITVSGASSGNGTWTSSDFDYLRSEIANTLNLSADWVGQPQPTSSDTWGKQNSSHDFNAFEPTPGAPAAVQNYALLAGNGPGDQMRLFSFAPIAFGGPGARFTVGDTVSLDLSVLIEAALAPDAISGDTIRLTGLPPGLSFDPTTFLLTGQVLGQPSPKGVQLQVRKGSKVLRSLPYNLAIDPYPYAGGFEALLSSDFTSEFTNTTGITIPSSGDANPYPSTITVADIDFTVTAVRVKLNGFTHTWLADVDIFLMAPDGTVSAVLSDAGNFGGVNNANLVFADDAPAPIPNDDSGSPYNGTYQPVDYQPGETPPGTVGPVGNSLNALAASGVNGEWKLFVSDDDFGFGGSIASWALEFDLSGPIGKITVTVASPTKRNPNPAYSAIVERLGQPRRTARGQFMLTPSGPTQLIPVTFPAKRTLPEDTYDLTFEQATQTVTGTQSGAPGVTALGFRLLRPYRVPSGNPAINFAFLNAYEPDGTINPGGIGHATGKLKSRARLSLGGLLGDGQPFTASLNYSETS